MWREEGMNTAGHKAGMQMVQHQDGLPIIIHPSWAADVSKRSRSIREVIQCRIPSLVQLWPCLHR